MNLIVGFQGVIQIGLAARGLILTFKWLRKIEDATVLLWHRLALLEQVQLRVPICSLTVIERLELLILEVKLVLSNLRGALTVDPLIVSEISRMIISPTVIVNHILLPQLLLLPVLFTKVPIVILLGIMVWLIE